MMKYFFKLCILLLLVIFNTNSVFAATSFPGLETITWKTGQVIGVSEMKSDPSTFLFEAGTGSRYGHVGLVVVEPDGVFVYEETPPNAQKSKIADFLARTATSTDGKLEATVIEPTLELNPADQEKLIATINEIIQKKTPYNFKIAMNADSMNCSEFVYHAFQSIGRNVGEIEPFSAMNIHAFQGMLMRFLGTGDGLNAQSKIVTPLSVIQSSSMRVVQANLPVDQILSEATILSAWTTEGGLDEFVQMIGLPTSIIEQLKTSASTQPYRPFPPSWRNLECNLVMGGSHEIHSSRNTPMD